MECQLSVVPPLIMMHSLVAFSRLADSSSFVPCKLISTKKVCARAHVSASALSVGRTIRKQCPRDTTLHFKAQSTKLTTAETEVGAVEVELKVKGMTCEHCSSRVRDALKDLQNVKRVEVSLKSGVVKAEVDAPSYFDAWNQLPQICETVTSLGFEAEPHFSDPEVDESAASN